MGVLRMEIKYHLNNLRLNIIHLFLLLFLKEYLEKYHCRENEDLFGRIIKRIKELIILSYESVKEKIN